MGIEPTSEAWEASILPLYDARSGRQLADYTQPGNCSYTLAILQLFDVAVQNLHQAFRSLRLPGIHF